MKQKFLILISVILALCIFTGCPSATTLPEKSIVSSSSLPEFSQAAYITLNGNVPYFSPDDYPKESFEEYSELDFLGRC
jgi:DNA-entry nuclease